MSINIPFFSTPDKTLSASVQENLPVADVVEGIPLFKNGGAALIMKSSSLNFGLLSGREQQAVIAAYAALLNSLTFPLQIVVRSQRKDIRNYTDLINVEKNKIKNEKLKVIMEDYQKFILDSIKKKNVLSKSFYLVIPFSQYELGVSKSFQQNFSQSKGNKALPYSKSYVVRKAKITLYPKRDHLIRQAGRLGIHLQQLTNEEIVELLFNIYNPIPPVKDDSVFK